MRNVIPRISQLNTTLFESPPCICCNEPHHLATCKKFKTFTVEERRDYAQNNRICYNCLSRNHRVTTCSSKFGCKLCKRRHHTLLHDNAFTSVTTSNNQVKGSPDVPNQTIKANNAQIEDETSESGVKQQDIQVHLTTNLACFSTILPTALAKVKDNSGKFILCRILLDSGSQASFISESCMQRLCLSRTNAKLTVSGIATNNQYTRGMTSIIIKSRFESDRTFEMTVFILKKLTTIPPVANFNIKNYDYLKNLQLADPNFDKINEIDIVLGSNKFFEVLENGRLKGDDGHPIAQNTAFGWILSGEISCNNSNIYNHNITIDDDNIDCTLRKFFECEELETSVNAHLTEEEKAVEEHFKANVTREQNGRYTVAIPFKTSDPALGQSAHMAIQRLKSVERRMLKDHQYKKMYSEFMESYLKLDHMERIDGDKTILTDTHHCYLPHHAVLKSSSTTTKLRTVFDGSCKTSNGKSLNDILMVGPTIQPALWSILLRFRIHPIALSADIEKMYRQVKVRERDTNFQRIVWRNSPDLPVEHFRLKTVTYGTSAAPFLAIRSLHQLANDNESKLPRLAQIIRNDFYVDDLLTGTTDINEASNLKQDLITLLHSGGFPLRKWVSNIPGLCDDAGPISIDDKDATIKVLGLAWDPKKDNFQFNVKLNDNIKYTKRNLLSESSKVFDPFGWLAPSIIIIKILFQKLWLTKLDWDDELPPDITNQWNQLRDSFSHLETIRIPRYIPWNISSVQFHGFCDASEAAYAAVIYCRFEDNTGNIQVNMLTSKTKVAPLKQVTLPRLELCAAVLLSRMFAKVKKEFAQFNIKEFCWTDSSIVLAWLSAEPRRWKTYVANRTSEILCTLPRNRWDHVRSAENPADCASRGILPKALKSFDLWWHGPKWLKESESSWKIKTTYPSTTELILTEERKKRVQCLQIQASNDTMETLFKRISSWRRIRRILGFCTRFIKNSQEKLKENRNYGTLTVRELQLAERACISWCQMEYYAEDMANLAKSGSLSSKGKLSILSPFKDEQGILRVGGRLQNSECSYDTKHPIILPNSHILSKMIATYYHYKYLHPGPSLLSSLLRQKFWIVHGRSMTRQVAHKCQVCVRQRAATSTQLMGTLPTARVTVSRPFSRVGVDFCGPISIATKKGRGTKYVKGYISVFVCMTIKAIHLEVVSDLTADAFLAALKRFIARRGLPSEIYSDNGTNFVGAHRKIVELFHNIGKINNTSIISDYLNDCGISWKFIPPASPNFAGLWEAAVKSMKAHLIRVTGNSNLTFEEMATLTCQIEAILNSRPLCQAKSDDPTSLDVLTPGHFLTMAPLTTLPEANFELVPTNRLTRWEQITKRMGSFWKRYSQDYLHTLQQRSKWRQQQKNLQIDDIVLVKDDNLPPCEWLKARITELHPGKDGLVRVVTLRTSKSALKRPVTKIVPLPIN